MGEVTQPHVCEVARGNREVRERMKERWKKLLTDLSRDEETEGRLR